MFPHILKVWLTPMVSRQVPAFLFAPPHLADSPGIDICSCADLSSTLLCNLSKTKSVQPVPLVSLASHYLCFCLGIGLEYSQLSYCAWIYLLFQHYHFYFQIHYLHRIRREPQINVRRFQRGIFSSQRFFVTERQASQLNPKSQH